MKTKKLIKFKKFLAMTLVIATIIMLPGFMVGVSAINRSLTKSSNDLFFDEDNRVDDIDLGEVSDDGIIPSSYFDYEIYKDRFVQSNKDKDNDINIETLNPRTNSTPEMSTYLKMYKYNNDTSYGNVDLSTGDLNTSFNLAKLVGNNGMDLELSIRYSSDDSKNGEAVWTNLTGETIYYALYKSEVYKLEVLDYSYIRKETFETEAEREAYIQSISEEITEYGDYTYYDNIYYGKGSETLPGISYILKGDYVRRNGLYSGWSFDIPGIETITYFNVDTGVYDTSTKVLTLENGKRYNIASGGFSYLMVNNISINSVNLSINNQTAKTKVTLKDGTAYYFDNDGLCIRKEDRLGNGINYSYITNNSVTYLSSMSDDYGRSINITYYNGYIQVTSNDTVSAVISYGTIGGDLFTPSKPTVSSITYNNEETYIFGYEEETYEVDLGINNSDYEEYILLTSVTHPNGDSNNYVYTSIDTPWGESGRKDIPMVAGSYDVISNNTCNSITYTRTGNSYESYFQRLNGGTVYNYTVTVSKTSGDRVYTYNINDLLLSDSHGYMITENTYTNNMPTMVVTRDYGSNVNGNYVESVNYYTYDNKGNVLTHTEPNNITTSYTYDSTYYLLTSETRLGREKVYTLSNDKKKVVEYTLRENNVVYDRVSYTYDSKGNVITKTQYVYPGNSTIVTTYDYDDNVVRNIDLDGLYLTEASVNNTTYSTTAKYDIAGRVKSTIDANGNETEYTYDNLGRVVRIDYEDNTYETYTYSVLDNSVTNRNRNGYITKSVYNIYDEEVYVYEVNPNTQGLTLLKTNVYDTNYRLLRETDGLGNYVTYTYDLRDRVTNKRVYDGNDNLAYRESYSYLVLSNKLRNIKTIVGNNTYSPNISYVEYTNNLGQLVKEGTIKGSSEVVSTYVYDNYGYAVSKTDARGNTSNYTYDIYGNTLTCTDNENNTTTWTYNNLGQCLSLTDANGNVSTCSYDALGRKISETTGVDGTTYNRVSSYEYDDNGNATEIKVTDNAPGASTTYSKTTYTYDSNNKVTSEKQYEGNTISLQVDYTYNPYGEVLTQTIGNTLVQSKVYNLRGELVTVTDGLNQSESYTYNILGQVTSRVDRNGTTFTYTYDTLGNVLSETAVNGNASQSTVYTYTPTNQIRSINNGDVLITREYDCFGRLIKETEDDGVDEYILEYTYDNNGNRTHLIETLNEDIVKEEYYAYNKNNQVVSVGNYELVEHVIQDPEYEENAIVDSSGNTIFTYSTTSTLGSYGINIYDENEVLDEVIYLTPYSQFATYTSISGSLYKDSNDEFISGTIYVTDFYGTRTYYFYDFENDNQGNSIVEGVSIGYYVTDSNGDRVYTVFVDNDGLSDDYYCWITSTIYNPSVRLIINNDTRLDGSTSNRDSSIYVWEAVGNYVTYTYDSNGNVLTATYSNGTSTIYTYTEGNLVKSVTNKRGNTILSSYVYTYYLSGNVKTITENGSIVKNYVYDRLGRLTSETIVDGNDTDSYAYTYDSRGNRSTLVHNGITTSYSYDNNNRLVAELEGISLKSYTYDNNGNNISVLLNGNTAFTYTYDLYSRQVLYTWNNIGYTSYTYRGDGLRHSKGNIKHFWDGQNITLEKSGANIIEYYRGLTLIFKKENSVKTYYLYNGHLDVTGLSSDAGIITKTYKYDAFGVEIDIDSNDTNAFRYCGEYYDTESKNIYLRARYYTSSTGRFTSEDPIKDGYNWYIYCNNNPINLIDPSGLRVTREASYVIIDDSIHCGYIIPYGSAPTFVERKRISKNKLSVNTNCYGYALGIYDSVIYVGELCGNVVPLYYDEPIDFNVEHVYDLVKEDLSVFGINVRKLDSYDSEINNHERRVAMRVTSKNIIVQGEDKYYYDYHFMVQTSTGQWAEVRGDEGPTYIYPIEINPSDLIWIVLDTNDTPTLVGEECFDQKYDSDIIYFAIEGKFTETDKEIIKKNHYILYKERSI